MRVFGFLKHDVVSLFEVKSIDLQKSDLIIKTHSRSDRRLRKRSTVKSLAIRAAPGREAALDEFHALLNSLKQALPDIHANHQQELFKQIERINSSDRLGKQLDSLYLFNCMLIPKQCLLFRLQTRKRQAARGLDTRRRRRVHLKLHLGNLSLLFFL